MQAHGGITKCCAMFPRVEFHAIAFLVMQTDMFLGIHARQVPRHIVAPIKVDLVTMRAWLCRRDAISHIPFVCQSVGRINITIGRLISIS